MMDVLKKALHERFGLPGFRPLQREIIEGILSRRNVIAVLATGGGKSLCFQLPALFVEGLTLVITPLVALMEDQVNRVNDLGIRGTFLSSVLEEREKKERLKRLSEGAYQIVFIAPERLNSPDLNRALEKYPPRFIAIDEAHCISQWGHDFRPSYMDIDPFIRRYDIPFRAAFTGTATLKTLEDMEESLQWDKTQVFKSTFDRPNLKYMAYAFPNGLKKLYAMKGLLSRMSGSGAIYCATRKDVEQIYRLLRMWGADPCMYHAGLPSDYRRKSQSQWVSGQKSLIVATNAFGMGIDKPDVRFVIHYQIPGNPENYYQEAGRAGRDRQASFCILLYSPEDRKIQESFLAKHHWDPEEMLAFMKQKKIPEDVPDYLKQFMTDRCDSVHTDLKKIIGELEQLKSYASLQLNKFHEMEKYVLSESCRRSYILNYFNEKDSFSNCGGCDTCLSWSPEEISTDYLPGTEDLREDKQNVLRVCRRLNTRKVCWDLFHGRSRPFIRIFLNHAEKNRQIREIFPFLWMTFGRQKVQNQSPDVFFPVSEEEMGVKFFPELLLKKYHVFLNRGEKRLKHWRKVRAGLPCAFLYPLFSARILAGIVTEDEIRVLWPAVNDYVIREFRKYCEDVHRCLPPAYRNTVKKLLRKGLSQEIILKYFFGDCGVFSERDGTKENSNRLD